MGFEGSQEHIESAHFCKVRVHGLELLWLSLVKVDLKSYMTIKSGINLGMEM